MPLGTVFVSLMPNGTASCFSFRISRRVLELRARGQESFRSPYENRRPLLASEAARIFRHGVRAFVAILKAAGDAGHPSLPSMATIENYHGLVITSAREYGSGDCEHTCNTIFRY